MIFAATENGASDRGHALAISRITIFQTPTRDILYISCSDAKGLAHLADHSFLPSNRESGWSLLQMSVNIHSYLPESFRDQAERTLHSLALRWEGSVRSCGKEHLAQVEVQSRHIITNLSFSIPLPFSLLFLPSPSRKVTRTSI